MFPKKEIEFKFDIIIGASSIIKGDIESEGSIRIDGKVIGDVKSLGNVIVTEDAYINGNVSCSSVDIYGSIEGNVKTKGKINLFEKASLTGDIVCKGFSTDEGSTFNGNCCVNPSDEIIIEVDSLISEKRTNEKLIDFKKNTFSKNKSENQETEKTEKTDNAKKA